MRGCDLTSGSTNSESGPQIGLSAYSSKTTKIDPSSGKVSVARSVNSFKSYKTDDSLASCLFVTQLQKKLKGCRRSFSEYSSDIIESSQPKRQRGPKIAAGKKLPPTFDSLK